MGKRILVADDSVTIQRAFAMVFGVEDVTLVAARSWDEAVSAARQQRPDLIFADVNLGDRSGYDLCATLKGDGALAQVPVYILASNQVPFEPAKGEQCRADGSFLKPFDSQKLLEAVAKIWSEGAAAAPGPAPAQDVPQEVAAESTSRIEVGDLAFEDEDSYGEFTIEPTAGGPAPSPTPPPVVVAPPPARPVPPQVSRPSFPIPPARPPAPAPAPVPVAAPAVSRPMALPVAPRPVAPPAPAPVPLAASASEPTAPKWPPRPSLIPGVMPPRSGGDPAPVGPVVLGRMSVGPAPSAPMDFGRTMMGMPAAVPKPAAVSASTERSTSKAVPVAQSGLPASLFDDIASQAQAPAPVGPLVDSPTPLGGKAKDGVGLLPDRTPSPVAAKVSAVLDDKIAEISARGPEYEAIAKLSREVIEQVVWEVVPELAEIMIREHIERLAKR